MRRTTTTLRLLLAAIAAAVAVGALAVSASGAGAASSNPTSATSSEVLSIENAQGRFEVRGRGYLNMRVSQGTVVVVDQSPTDRFSPYLAGVPRGKTSGATGRDINMYVLGGRYKVTVRGTGVNISARGEGVVVMTGEADATGNVGTIRIGDLVRPIAVGDAKATFGGLATADASGSSGGSSQTGSGRDAGKTS
jgi:hypothetical protein